MHIGLIGGIGPAATDLYYRGLIDALAAAGQVLDATIVHADAPTLVGNFERRDAAAQAEIYLRLADRLAAAGCEAMAITSIGGHFCIDAFRPHAPLPLIDFLEELDRDIARRRLTRVGVLGTDTVMATGIYGGIKSAEVLAPEGPALVRVHQNYRDMAIAGHVTEPQRQVFFEEGQALVDRGAETVLLGGTDLFLAFDGQTPGFEVLDCAKVHIAAIARVAMKAD